MTHDELQANIEQKIARYRGTIVVHHLTSGWSYALTAFSFVCMVANAAVVARTGAWYMLFWSIPFACFTVAYGKQAVKSYYTGKNMVWAEEELLKAVLAYTKNHSFARLMSCLPSDDMSFLHSVCRARRWHSRRIIPFG